MYQFEERSLILTVLIILDLLLIYNSLINHDII